MKISIVIPTYNQFRYVFDCLESLKNTTDNYVVHVIDDGSSKWTNEVRDRILSLIPDGSKLDRFEENHGCTRSWNLGLQSSSEEVTVLANSDVLFSKDWLKGIESALNQFSLVGPLTNAPGDSPVQNIKLWVPDYEISDDQASIDKTNFELRLEPFKSKFVNGFFMAAKTVDWKTNSFDELHVFNPKFKLVGNEVELQKRWKGEIGVANCFIFHYRSVSRKSKIFNNGKYRKTPLI